MLILYAGVVNRVFLNAGAAKVWNRCDKLFELNKGSITKL